MKSAEVWGQKTGKEYVVNLLQMRDEQIGVMSGGFVKRIPSVDNPFSQDIYLQSKDITAVACSDDVLWSCTNRGLVGAWDFRASTSAPVASVQTNTPYMSCMDVGFQGSLLACGTEEGIESKIVFFDTRQIGREPLGQYVESHSDSITTVKFQGQMFFSGSVDGLVCGFDITQPNETLALVSVMKPNGACLKLGCFGTRGLFATTSSETFHLFDYETAQTIGSYDNDVMLGTGCRELLMERTMLGNEKKMEINYLIDGLWEARTQKLLLLAGNSEGGAFGYEVTLGGFQPLGPLTGVHTEVVRCAKTYDGGKSSGFNILTGAEDGRVCLWKPDL
ncbi:hypothetical protein BASA81_001740 [Batrachochytrium salamandrivorans]|nr:hypothetical protein BASA81_001740 [Batrachochytrium salamandrivorans]